MGEAEIFGLARLSVGGFLASVGFAIVFVGSLAHLRLPDVYTRAHGAALSDGLGAALIALGLAIAAPDSGVATRLLVLAGLLFAMNRAFSHVSVAAAHWGGLTPVTDVKKRSKRG
jgi:multicomponent Na+:H+ antiporter subunit G